MIHDRPSLTKGFVFGAIIQSIAILVRAMKKYTQSIKEYLSTESAKEMIIGVSIVLGFVAIVSVIVLLIQQNTTKIVYQPSVACVMFTEEEAKELLGAQVLPNKSGNPVLSGHVATTKCSYSDVNSDQDGMLVAAVAVRSGIDDEGTAQNTAEFTASMAGKDTEPVSGLGDSAYFDPATGQLHVLRGHDWVILSFGVGTAPEANTLDDALQLAQRVLYTSELPTF